MLLKANRGMWTLTSQYFNGTLLIFTYILCCEEPEWFIFGLNVSFNLTSKIIEDNKKKKIPHPICFYQSDKTNAIQTQNFTSTDKKKCL